MNQPRTDEELEVLLARGGLAPTRRDAILETVLDQARSEHATRSQWRWAFGGLGFAAAAAMALLLVAPWRPTTVSTFRAKGAGTATPAAELECLGGTLAACPAGSLLVVHASGVRGYVAAWAEPVDGGERIWYFSAETSSPLVDGNHANATSTVRAVKIGPEHRPGAYVVEMRVTEQPMMRGDLLGLPAGTALMTARSQLAITSP